MNDGGDAGMGAGLFGDLRYCITQANHNPGPNSIDFLLPGPGPHVITVGTDELPTIDAPLDINGYTQPDSHFNTSQIGDNAVPQVVIDGSSNPLDFGLVIDTVNSSVSGLVIYGFQRSAISITGENGNGNNNRIQGNFLGTDTTGTVGMGNGLSGIVIRNSASGNLIGGPTPASRNIISGNGQDGISLYGDSNGNTVQGNYVGTDITGTTTLGKQQDGVEISDFSSQNAIGGTQPGAGNVISGNVAAGVHILGDQSYLTQLQQNYIGTDASGSNPVPNGIGVNIVGASFTLVGGTDSLAGNLISGNTGYGVYISGTGATLNLLQGNFIGTDVNGAKPLGNLDGIEIAANGNTVGGAQGGARNLISGNRAYGINIRGGNLLGNNNQVLGNYVGVDVSGTKPVPNNTDGILITDGNSNQIGSSAPGARNVISGNGTPGVGSPGNGVRIVGNGPSGTLNRIQGNYIGTNAAGSRAIPNIANGVSVEGGARATLIGGPGAMDGNLMSGNQAKAIYDGGVGTVINGNSVGLDKDGNALPNEEGGIELGGTGALVLQNDIAYNDGPGIEIDSGSTDNLIETNSITANTLDGILVDANSSNNEIGGGDPTLGNTIAGNGSAGVHLLSGNGNPVSFNTINQNTSDGVLVESGDGQTITGNTISSNGDAGVLIQAGDSDVISDNSISSNAAQGILLQASNADTISGNTISANVADGVSLAGTSNLLIGGSGAANVITLNGGAGVLIPSGTDITVSFNTISQNTLGGVVVTGGSAYPTCLLDENVLDSLIVSGGSVDVAGPSPVGTVTFSGGTISGPSLLEVLYHIDWTGGLFAGTGSTNVDAGATGNFHSDAGLELQRLLNNAGTITWTGSGNISIDAGAAFNNLTTGLVEAEGTGALMTQDGSGAFNNTGTFAQTGVASLPPGANLPFTNWGTVRVLPAATFALHGNYTQLAGLTAVDFATALITGSLAEDAGLVTLGDATGGGTLWAPGGVQVASGAVFSGYGTITGDVTNAGEVDAQNPAGSAGSLAVAGNYTQTAGVTNVNFFGSALSVTNAFTQGGGSLTVGPGGTLAVGASFFLTGGTGYIDGTVAVTGSYSQTGGLMNVIDTLSTGGVLSLGGGNLVLAVGSLSAAGGVQVLLGGTLSGPGTVNANVSNAGTIAVGDSSSSYILYVNGNYTQTSAGVLAVNYGFGSHLAVSGAATLDGTLLVTNMSVGATPLTYGSHSGTFASVQVPPPPLGNWDFEYNPLSFDVRIMFRFP